MSANFTPTQTAIADLRPFRMWCQKVLPAIYDESLSYYELLCKVVDYINQNIDDINALNDNVENIYNAYILLQDYVNDYFENEAPQMVSDKIDEMAEDGTLTALISNYVDPIFEAKADELDGIVEEQNNTISEAITEQNTTIDNAITQQNTTIDNAITQQNTTLNSAINSQNSNISTMQTQLTNFLTSETPDANAELIDIRVGADNTIYPSAGDAVRGQVTQLNSAFNAFVEEGKVISHHQVNWNNGYIDINGVIRASQASRFALVSLTEGETVEIGTANSNITIIGSTTANSVAVGDTVTVIQKTTTAQFETHTYTATESINLVLCVLYSNYSLKFYKKSDLLETIGAEIQELTYSVNDIGEFVPNGITDGYIYGHVVANGSFTGDGVTTGITNRIRTDLIQINAGDRIDIENGNFVHACGIWKESVSSPNIIRNDNTFITTDETVIAEYDGYIVIVFADANNYSRNITPSDFDGTIKLYTTLAYRNYVRISNVEEVINEDPYQLPSYYYDNEYIKNKADRINELGKQSDDVFAFITDIHWELNAKHSTNLLKYLSDNCAIHKLFNGGDVADTSMLNVYKMYRDRLDGRVYHITGNHDWFYPQNGKDLYYTMDSANNNQIGNAFEHYYYVDNIQQKIRYVILNCFGREEESTTLTVEYDATQIAWFANDALNLPTNDWDVIVFTHILKTTSINVYGASDIISIIDTFNADNRHTGKILGVFQGHTHWDGIYYTNGGLPIITTTCDKYNFSNEPELAQEQPGRVLDTITEQAFDVVVLNRTEKTFTCVRVGAPAQNNDNLVRTDNDFEWIGTLQERVISYA